MTTHCETCISRDANVHRDADNGTSMSMPPPPLICDRGLGPFWFKRFKKYYLKGGTALKLYGVQRICYVLS